MAAPKLGIHPAEQRKVVFGSCGWLGSSYNGSSYKRTRGRNFSRTASASAGFGPARCSWSSNNSQLLVCQRFAV